jgi:flagellar biosynthesis protein FliQ
MNSNGFILLLREGLEVAFLLCVPALLTSLLMGLVVSLLQATTQMQDQTLSFVPKIAAVGASLFVCAGWMTGVATRFAHHAIELLPRLAR